MESWKDAFVPARWPGYLKIMFPIGLLGIPLGLMVPFVEQERALATSNGRWWVAALVLVFFLVFAALGFVRFERKRGSPLENGLRGKFSVCINALALIFITAMAIKADGHITTYLKLYNLTVAMSDVGKALEPGQPLDELNRKRDALLELGMPEATIGAHYLHASILIKNRHWQEALEPIAKLRELAVQLRETMPKAGWERLDDTAVYLDAFEARARRNLGDAEAAIKPLHLAAKKFGMKLAQQRGGVLALAEYLLLLRGKYPPQGYARLIGLVKPWSGGEKAPDPARAVIALLRVHNLLDLEKRADAFAAFEPLAKVLLKPESKPEPDSLRLIWEVAERLAATESVPATKTGLSLLQAGAERALQEAGEKVPVREIASAASIVPAPATAQ